MSNRADDSKTSAVFISYSRRDSEIADSIVKAMEAGGRDVWLDKGAIPDLAEWRQEIRDGIDKSDAVIFLLSRDFCASAECQTELEHALKNGKRLVPVCVAEVDYALVAPSLASINWIDISAAETLDEGVAQIIRALDTDLVWAKLHTGVTRRLAQYEQRDDDTSLLLRGRELSEIEAAFAAAEGKDPHPADEQRKFIAESRRIANRRQRFAIGALAVGLIVSIALGTAAYFQRNAAREARDEARDRLYASQIQLARNQADTEPDLAFATLHDTARTAGDLREFTWDLLADKVARKLFAVGSALDPTRTSDKAFAIALSADGRRLAVAGKRRSLPGEEGRAISLIHVWNIDNGALVRRLSVQAMRTESLIDIGSLALSHDGALVAAYRNNSVEVWDVTTGEQLMSQKTDTFSEGAVRFPPVDRSDGEVPALLLVDKMMVRFWPQIGDAPVQVRPLDFIRAFEFREDGRGLRLLGKKNVFALNFGSREVVPEGSDQELVFSAKDISALPHRLLGRGYGTIDIIERDRKSGAWVRAAVLRGAHSSVTALTRLSADGRWAVTAGGDNKIVVWNLEARRRALVLDGLRGEAIALAISRDGKRIAASDDEGALIVWEAGNGIVLPDIHRNRRTSDRCAQVTSDGHVLSVEDGVAFFQRADGATNTIMTGGVVRACTLSPRSDIAIFMYEEGGALIWETRTGRMFSIERDIGAGGIAISPDETTIAGWDDGRIILLDLPSGDFRAEVGEAGGTGQSIVYVAPGQVIAHKSTEDGEVVLTIDADAGTILGRITLSERPDKLTFCPDRHYLAVTFEHEAAIYDLASGTRGEPFEWTKKYGLHAPQALAFTPDCGALIIGDQSGRLAVWDLAERIPVIDITANSGMTVVTYSFGGGSTKAGSRRRVVGRGVTAVAISPDGRTLATGGGTEAGVGELRLWDASSGLLLADLPAEEGLVVGLVFSSDGTRLGVTMDPEPVTRSGRIIEVWDARARMPFTVTLAHHAPIASLAQLPDGLIRSASSDPEETRRYWRLGPDGLRPTDAPFWIGLAEALPEWLWPADEPAVARPTVEFVTSGSVDITAPGWVGPVRVAHAIRRPSIFEARAAVRTRDGVLTLQFLGDQTLYESHILIERGKLDGGLPRLAEVHEPLIAAPAVAELPDGKRFALAGTTATPNDSTGIIRFWDSEGLAPTASFVGHQRRLNTMLVVPEAEVILTGDEAGIIHAWPLLRNDTDRSNVPE